MRVRVHPSKKPTPFKRTAINLKYKYKSMDFKIWSYFLKNFVDSKGITISFATHSNAGVVQW